MNTEKFLFDICAIAQPTFIKENDRIIPAIDVESKENAIAFINKTLYPKEDAGCWICKHRCVCKYWEAANPKYFPFITDQHINPFLIDIAMAYANACNHFSEKDK